MNRLRIVVRISGARTKKWADLSRLKKEQPPKLIRNERKSRDELPTLDTYGLKRTSLQRLNLAFGRDAVAFSSRRSSSCQAMHALLAIEGRR